MNPKIIYFVILAELALCLSPRIFAATVTADPNGSGTVIHTTPEEGAATLALHKKERIVEDLWTVISLLDDRTKVKDYALVNIVIGNANDNVFSMLNLSDPTKPPVNIPYVFQWQMANGHGEINRVYVPYFVKGTVLALCKINAISIVGSVTSLAGGKPATITDVPDTLMLPSDWSAEMAKLLTSADNKQYLAAFNDDFSKSKLATLIYGNELAKSDFQKFSTEFPHFMAGSDIYAGGALTALLLTEGNTNKQSAWDEISKLISSTVDPAVVEGVTLGLRVYTLNNHIDEKDRLQISHTYDLLQQKENITDPEWQTAWKIIHLQDSIYEQAMKKEAAKAP